MSNKTTGSFYTPYKLIEYMVEYVKQRDNPKSVLEPSAGDGRFVLPLESYSRPITLVENDPTKAKELQIKYSKKCAVHSSDFLDYALDAKEQFDLIIGNPPYIPKKTLPQVQRDKSKKLIDHFSLDSAIFQNIWVSFILGSIKILSSTGSIFFVLPFEFLQVQYAEKLRNFLEEKFNTIEITTFERRVFTEIEQDICLVYLSNKLNAKPYIQYTTLYSDSDPKVVFQSIIERNKPLSKWSNCILNDLETDRLLDISKRFPQISTFGDISPGIVTGANSFFSLSYEEMKKLNVPDKNQLPILMKSSDIPPLLLFTEQDFLAISTSKSRSQLLRLTGWSQSDFPSELKKYLKAGKKKNIHKRYKCKSRKRWYDVPIVATGDACFFKRYDALPRLIVNVAGVHTTDIAYNIRFKKDTDASSFAFCFYNSLTLAMCEYTGRFYGGGVGELVPSEFKAICIPYRAIAKEQVYKLDEMIRSKKNVQDIIDYVDSIVLSDLSQEEVTLLRNIRNRYITRRIR